MAVASKPAKQDKTTIALLLVAALVAIGGIGFAAGRVTAGSTAPANNGGLTGRGGGTGGFVRPSLAPGQTFDAGQFAGGNGGVGRNGGIAGGVTGTVVSVDGSTMTVKLANGTTVTVDLSGSTTYHTATSATSGDVKAGAQVTVSIDTAALVGETPNPSASGGLGGRTITAKDVLITTP
jgi:preprotein translocase subunit YajC